ncbi:histidine kinase dimerization/phosphoacceptor domain -containing protein [Brevundimonas variabilis]|uniref:PAS domain S-box-containing protein n=1 Tax=Brevundimonas variabilis TaxID=74312 RepID=A0A7W9CF77_9CAUL|nr:histidine kinase dimerization/phosphoacceptor domain -containing protein [Brevundimonas variabilis]MBB5744517.1 PAS domain S-box-containing protein [Brevundimonas variabilis]
MKQKDDWHLTDVVEHKVGRGDPFAAAIRGTRMAMVITNPRLPDNPIVFANKAFQDLTGYERDEIIGQNCRFLQGPDTSREAVANIRSALAEEHDIQVDLLNYRKDGTTFWNALFISPVRNDAGQVDYFFASQLDVTDRVEAQRFVEKQKALVDREVALRTADLEEALASKTLLLHEVDHRVKNNLTMIGSLLRLQARSLPDPSLGQTLNSMLERVDALATVHRRLYQSNDITTFDAGAFVETLAADVIGSSGRANIAVEVDVEPIMIPSAHASAVGLVVNELLTNAVKHGFPDGREGTLKVTATQSQRRGRIVIQDDGPGIVATANNGLGKTLISRLVRQIDGEARWLPANPGTRVVLEFPVSG